MKAALLPKQSYTLCPRTDNLWHNFSYTQKNYQWDEEFAHGVVNSGVRCLLQLIGSAASSGQDSVIRWPAQTTLTGNHCNLSQCGQESMECDLLRDMASTFPWSVGLFIYTVRIINSKKSFHVGTTPAIILTFTPRQMVSVRRGSFLGASGWIHKQSEIELPPWYFLHPATGLCNVHLGQPVGNTGWGFEPLPAYLHPSVESPPVSWTEIILPSVLRWRWCREQATSAGSQLILFKSL